MTGIARVRRPDWHDVLPLLLVALVALAFVLLLVGVVKNDTHLAGAPAPQTTHQLTGDALRAL
jgi:hypothetical protein